MALVGNIRDFSLSDFLYLVDRGYKTGCLHLTHGSEKAILFFDKGKLIYASRNQDELLSGLLIKQGKLTAPQLEHAKQSQGNGSNGTTLTQILLAENMLSHEDLQHTLQSHTEESVYGLFGWAEGEFRFEQGQKPDPNEPVMPIPLPVENLIMEGVRRIDEWGRIKDRIPSTDMIVRFLEQPGEKAKGVKLAPEEWRVFARINGKDTLADIAQKTKLSEFDVCRIVYGFVTAGLVDVVKKPRPMPQSLGTRGTQPIAAPRIKKSLVSRIINRIRGM